MESSFFTDKTKIPTDAGLAEVLGNRYLLWKEITGMMLAKCPNATAEWNFFSAKFGWNYRIKDKKRVLIYLVPFDKNFKVSFVFGQKAFDRIMDSTIAEEIKAELRVATAYVEGRGLRLDVNNRKIMKDIELLMEIKIAK